MIVAHFTASDSSSTALVLGIGLVVIGARGMWSDDEGRRRRGVRILLMGLAATAAGLAAGFAHVGT